MATAAMTPPAPIDGYGGASLHCTALHLNPPPAQLNDNGGAARAGVKGACGAAPRSKTLDSGAKRAALLLLAGLGGGWILRPHVTPDPPIPLEEELRFTALTLFVEKDQIVLKLL